MYTPPREGMPNLAATPKGWSSVPHATRCCPRLRAGGAACLTLTALVLPSSISRVQAHSAPYSTLEVYLRPDGLVGSLTFHVFDIAQGLKIDPPERLLDPTTAARVRSSIVELLAPRLQIRADGTTIAPRWEELTPVPEIQSLRLTYSASAAPPAALSFRARLFPYDPTHQTFINLYEHEVLRQQLVINVGDGERTYFTDTREGRLAVVAAFIPLAIRRILNGPGDLVFLVGLLLLAGRGRPMLRLVAAFIAGHTVALLLTAVGIVKPDSAMIEAAFGMTVICVGVDNLLVLFGSNGLGVRESVALICGLVRGSGFVTALQELRFPRGILEWSQVSFSAGVELGQILVLAGVGSGLFVLRRFGRTAERRMAYAVSLAITGTGVYWFMQRLLHSGGSF